MALGKSSKDIFTSTTTPKAKARPADRPRSAKVARVRTSIGRPPAPEAYEKVTVCLFQRQILWLDEQALERRRKTGKPVRRAELIRELIEKAMR